MTPQQLESFCPSAGTFWPGLTKASALFYIDTPLRQAHFLAQLAHESAGFTRFEENLNYGERGLLQTFSARVSPEKARELAHQPEAIANFVYGGRLGNDAPGDGWKYRGRGGLQLTGKSNYAQATSEIRKVDPTFPDLVASPDAAAGGDVWPVVAGWFWRAHALSLHADRDDLLSITRAINGGTNGLREREQWLVKAKGVLL